MSTHLSTSTLAAALRAAGFVGRIVEPDDPGFDEARAGWNGAIDRRPAAVAHAGDADDVAAAIRAARAEAVPFTIRGGGHSVAGRSVRDGALLIDLRGCSAVEVDPARAVVRVGGGALLSELDAATQEHGLAVPGGQISHTGVGGLTLGGGLGWLMRRHGLTIDSLLACDVVLADGRALRCSADEHPDLFWALRGGGGRLRGRHGVHVPRPPRRADGPGRHARVSLGPGGRGAPPGAGAHGRRAGGARDVRGPADRAAAGPVPAGAARAPGRRAERRVERRPGEGERVLAPLRAERPPVLDLVGPMPYVALQSMLDATAPHGLRYYDRLHYLDEVGDDLIGTLLAAMERSRRRRRTS
jgi:hypothetical protein